MKINNDNNEVRTPLHPTPALFDVNHFQYYQNGFSIRICISGRMGDENVKGGLKTVREDFDFVSF